MSYIIVFFRNLETITYGTEPENNIDMSKTVDTYLALCT